MRGLQLPQLCAQLRPVNDSEPAAMIKSIRTAIMQIHSRVPVRSSILSLSASSLLVMLGTREQSFLLL